MTKVHIGGADVLLAKPSTFMNLSGRAVQATLHWYKIDPSDMLVVHDDVSLPLGKIRFQHGGGAGGQHGVESIIEHIGRKSNFDRLKFGVGPDPGGEFRAAYVLSAPAADDLDLKEKTLAMAVEAVQVWIRSGVQQAMNLFNGRDLRPAPPTPPSAGSDEQPRSGDASTAV